jgi:acetyltransferase-like isoleucine patch superfamily enzyme
MSFLSRIFYYRNITENNGYSNISWSTKLNFQKTSKIDCENGLFQFGHPLSFETQFLTQNGSMINLGKNSKIIIKGNVYIAPGSSIFVHDNATLIFEGENVLAHNTKIHCYKKIKFGVGTSCSWNCSFMDWDGHEFIRLDGKKNDFYRPLIFGEYVGIQMNVICPKGIIVGDNSIISAGTVLRQDVPSNSLAFSNQELKVKYGYQSALNKN